MGQLTRTNKSVNITIIMSECDKPSTELLNEITDAKTDNLKHVQTRESVGSSHDMALVGVAKFDKTKLSIAKPKRSMSFHLPKISRRRRKKQKLKNTEGKFRVFLPFSIKYFRQHSRLIYL